MNSNSKDEKKREGRREDGGIENLYIYMQDEHVFFLERLASHAMP